jgi:hypothetical protein
MLHAAVHHCSGKCGVALPPTVCANLHVNSGWRCKGRLLLRVHRMLLHVLLVLLHERQHGGVVQGFRVRLQELHQLGGVLSAVRPLEPAQVLPLHQRGDGQPDAEAGQHVDAVGPVVSVLGNAGPQRTAHRR